MDTLIDIVKYIYIHYPHKKELSKARVVKMVYLADWKSAIVYGRQLSSINWYFNHYGPYVSSVIEVIRKDPDFNVSWVTNPLGEPKELVVLKNNVTQPNVSKDTKEILDFVISKTAPLYWEDFIKLVYSTYPIVNKPRFSELDLVSLAKEYIVSIKSKVEKS